MGKSLAIDLYERRKKACFIILFCKDESRDLVFPLKRVWGYVVKKGEKKSFIFKSSSSLKRDFFEYVANEKPFDFDRRDNQRMASRIRDFYSPLAEGRDEGRNKRADVRGRWRE